ncbi:polysaccharide deacetylase family protein [Paenibacillus flagellatus]|nr:polysaccharide deacetylase family protein [Paenibacillus flagellatus]
MNNRYELDIVGDSDRMEEAARARLDEWRGQAVRMARRLPEHVYVNGPDVREVALTFDDGPDERVTPAIAEALSRYGVKGSFFFVGSRVERHPDIVKAVYEAGHLVLNHSWNHDRLTTLGAAALRDDLRRTQEAISDAIGVRPALFRPPFGAADDSVVLAAGEEGCRTVLWSLDTLDWSQKEEAHIRWNVDNYVRNGEIVLMHSSPGCTETAKAMPRLLESLLEAGRRPVDLGRLLGLPAYLT